MKRIMVTGGAGFIGSHMVSMLVKHGYQVVVVDSLVTGNRDAVLGAKLLIGDLSDYFFLKNCFSNYKFDAIIHFAAFINLQESIIDPEKYYVNNVNNGLNLLRVAKEFSVKKIIFSSSAAIYGQSQNFPIDINHPKNPLNPYGQTKLIFENILQDYCLAYDMKSVSLRYFNASGADPQNLLGERHNPETHLIPLILQSASGRRSHVNIFGSDYQTKDGTAIRDYIHVVDLCEAHLLALEKILQNGHTDTYNVGNGSGYSVLEVINTVEQVTGKKINVVYSPRRDGDSPVLVADIDKIKKSLNWQPKHSDLYTIIEDAWKFEKKFAWL